MIEFRIIVTSEHADNLSAQLTLLGADAVTTVTLDEELSTTTTLLAYFEDDSMLVAATTLLDNQAEIQDYEASHLDNHDWIRASLDQFTPQKIGTRLWICPNWLEAPEPSAINIMLDPGHAFGTGTHPTTWLCLEWLEVNIAGNETIIDYGCGSGILSIAALKLGAAHVSAVDLDENALLATAENANTNQIPASTLTIHTPESAPNTPADILLANILAQPLAELEPLFAALVKPQGKIILSGILTEQADEVSARYANHFIMSEPVVKDGWVRLVGSRRE